MIEKMPDVSPNPLTDQVRVLTDIPANVPDFDAASPESMSVWLSGFLERVRGKLNLYGLMFFISSQTDTKVLASHGLEGTDTDRLIEAVEYSGDQIPAAMHHADGSTRSGTDHTDTITIKRDERFWTVIRADLPDDSRVWCVFVTDNDVDPGLGQVLAAVADHVARVATVGVMATQTGQLTQELEKTRQEITEMQMSSLNILEDLQRRNRDLETLNTLADDIASCTTLEELAKGAAEAASDMLDGATVAVYVYNDTGSFLEPAHMTGDHGLSDVDDIRIDAGDPILQKISDGKEIRFDHMDDSTGPKLAATIGAKTCILVPMCSRGRTLGLLAACETRWLRIFTDDDVANLRVFSTTLALAMENARLTARIADEADKGNALKEYTEAVVDSVDMGVIVVDADLTITMMNKGLERMYGHRQEEFRGKHMFEAFPHLMEQGCAEIAQQVFNGMPFERCGWRRRLADGREAVQNIRVAPQRDKSGKVSGAIVVIEDVTERARLEERLAKSEAKFSRVVEDLDDGYLIITDGKIAYANKAASTLTGRAAFKLLGLGISEIISDERLISECTGPTGAKLKVESRINHASGTWIPVDVTISSSEYGGRHVVSVIMSDITDKKKIEKQLEQKNREMRQRSEQITRLNLELEATVNKLKASQENLIKSERVAAITETAVAANHEINNPLFSVLGEAQLLLRKYKGQDEETLRRLRMIEESALRISCVTKKLANLADPVVKEYPGITAHMIDLDKSTTR
ncbi:MAG: PAS domain S-box protein [Candidatus Eisenbacteria bacterium]